MNKDIPLKDMLPAEIERVLDAYYYPAKKCYLIPKEGEGWVEVNAAGLKLALREHGLSKAGDPISPIDTFTHELHTQYDLDFAGALAGYRLGFYTINGRRILVTSQLQLPAAVKGECPTIKKLLERWFGEEQLPYVLGWLKHAYLNLLPKNKAHQPAQMLALCGEPGAGKNFFQDIVTEILGGRVAKPYRYLCGNTQFNSDLDSPFGLGAVAWGHGRFRQAQPRNVGPQATQINQGRIVDSGDRVRDHSRGRRHWNCDFAPNLEHSSAMNDPEKRPR